MNLITMKTQLARQLTVVLSLFVFMVLTGCITVNVDCKGGGPGGPCGGVMTADNGTTPVPPNTYNPDGSGPINNAGLFCAAKGTTCSALRKDRPCPPPGTGTCRDTYNSTSQ